MVHNVNSVGIMISATLHMIDALITYCTDKWSCEQTLFVYLVIICHEELLSRIILAISEVVSQMLLVWFRTTKRLLLPTYGLSGTVYSNEVRQAATVLCLTHISHKDNVSVIQPRHLYSCFIYTQHLRGEDKQSRNASWSGSNLKVRCISVSKREELRESHEFTATPQSVDIHVRSLKTSIITAAPSMQSSVTTTWLLFKRVEITKMLFLSQHLDMNHRWQKKISVSIIWYLISDVSELCTEIAQ